MLHLPRTMALLLVLVGLSALLAGGSASAQTPVQPGRAEIVAQLPRSISLARMRADLGALERIADRNGGNRAAGTPGYAASVRYVVAQLRRAGYRPQVTAFPYVEYLEHLERGRQITPVQRELPLEALQYSPSTPQGGIRARVVSSGDGCSAGDFGAAVRGLIALVERGTCFFSAKAANAQAARAVGVLVFNNEEGALDGTLGGPSASEIPVAGITRGLGRELAAAPNAVVELELVTQTRQARSQNITTDTRRAPRVLVVGAHLDSVRDGPGINDNATGVAALLEIARALKNRSNELAVRFAFWGAEELGLFGSRAYARTVPRERVTGYLNFDVLGSPSQRYGVYGVDRFAERWLGYLERRGMNAVRTGIGGRSDHAAFAQRGIPVGGLFAGGYACYHRACDRLANVDLGTLEDLASAAAYGVASFAPLAR